MIALTAEMASQNVFRALADPSRRQILHKLASQDLTIAEVAEGFDMSRPAVKKHLSILEHGQLISVTVRGRKRINKLEPNALKAVQDWLSYFDVFWDQKLNDLKTEIEKDDTHVK